ncbi:hypothetical protein DUI87_12301 [Hirundo rustica rustica]|uniref:Protein kinase domain-containing protein n=1 Tax=Hirundo rustica rustica TaxID=333673 RepID=A0A3M0KHY4_HIRRU|nr:hypothetical protein DUI87_12301 [Hirundo rustica rustica]
MLQEQQGWHRGSKVLRNPEACPGMGKGEVKLIDYIHRQRQCKLSVPLSDRTAELNSYPRFNDWLDIVNVRKEVVQDGFRTKLFLLFPTVHFECDAGVAFQPSEVLGGTAKVLEETIAITMQCLWRWATAKAAESADSGEPVTLRRVRGLGCAHLAGLQRIPEELTLDALLEMNESKVKETMKRCGARDEECSRLNGALSCLRKVTASETLLEALVLPAAGGRPRTPHSITVTPPATPQPKRRHRLKPPRTPPPPCRKVFQLLPNFPTLTRSKSHESQLGNRIDEVPPVKFSTKSWLSQICQVCQKSMMFGVKLTKIRRTESVPSDINNPVDRPTEPQFGTLPKALTKKAEEPEASKSEPEDDEDEVEDLPNRRPHLQGMIYRKPSQTSVYLQEWDIPFEQIQLGDPIGQGRWGKVYKGKWHGEVAIRLLEIDGNNQDHLKLFKKEVMNYRQTRHENVVLFMGACMNPPHLAIITSFCKGRTLHSFVRDPKISLDINKTRQIAQEIIKGMGYLHAKGIVHKDLKSKNVFYDNGKVVITDFGLFGISGVVQEGRRENELKLPHDWLCYLAPEIVREMAPGKDEDKLPFSKAADIYAFGTVWYELQAREWPFKTQPAEALIWQIGSGEGVRQVLATVSLGKEVNEILSACWAFDFSERPSFTVLMEMLEKLPKLNRRLSHPGHFWKSADINSSKVVLRFERFGLGILEASNPKL